MQQRKDWNSIKHKKDYFNNGSNKSNKKQKLHYNKQPAL